MKNQNKLHTVPSYFINPQHPITINLIGCGGTGSHMLTKLAQLNHALKELDHPGISVVAYDEDTVSPANIGRQAFFESDIGQNKATVLISRVNRAFGLNWVAMPTMYNKSLTQDKMNLSNITISCVDKGATRMKIAKTCRMKNSSFLQAYKTPYYWMDLGNDKNIGQVILGTINKIEQPKKSMVAELPTIEKIFPDLDQYDSEDKPSCSVRESLQHQDLCINAMMAEWGKKMLWSLFSKARIEYRGVFVNLDTFQTNPLKV